MGQVGSAYYWSRHVMAAQPFQDHKPFKTTSSGCASEKAAKGCVVRAYGVQAGTGQLALPDTASAGGCAVQAQRACGCAVCSNYQEACLQAKSGAHDSVTPFGPFGGARLGDTPWRPCQGVTIQGQGARRISALIIHAAPSSFTQHPHHSRSTPSHSIRGQR